MKKKSLSDRIYDYLKKVKVWIHSGEIEKMAIQAGYKGSTAGRVCRLLAEEGKIARKEEKSVWYKYAPQERKILTPTFTENGVQLKQQTIYD